MLHSCNQSLKTLIKLTEAKEIVPWEIVLQQYHVFSTSLN